MQTKKDTTNKFDNQLIRNQILGSRQRRHLKDTEFTGRCSASGPLLQDIYGPRGKRKLPPGIVLFEEPKNVINYPRN